MIALALAVGSPAFAQPFTDTSTTHWAYDAIAELFVKGLIKGYPDGTFKGDRTLTRYEMAMVVARLLAQLENLQVLPPSTPPVVEVTKADIDMILRLVHEFRAELAAKNVRLAAVEEELNSIKARLFDARVTGGMHFRYELKRAASGAALPGSDNPNTGAVDAGNSAMQNDARQTYKIGFDGAVTENVHFIVALASNGNVSQFHTFNSSAYGPASVATLASVDNAFFDWKNAFGWPLEIWLGRFGGTSPPGATYPVQFGPFGLLMNTAGETWEDTTGDSGFNVADGLRIAARFRELTDLQIQAVAIRIIGGTGSFSYASGEDAYGVDANIKILDGLRFGAYYVWNTIAQSGITAFTGPAPLGVLYHLYGPGGGSHNPVTANCPAGPGGIQCPASGNGYGAYVQWDIAKGIHLDGEWAQWNDSVLGGNDTGYQVVVTWDLAELLKVGQPLTLATGYLNYGQNFYPPYGAAEVDIAMADVIYPGNAQAFTATLTFTPAAQWTIFGMLVTGRHLSNGQSISEYEAGAKWAFASNADVTLRYRTVIINDVTQLQIYRAEVDYQF